MTQRPKFSIGYYLTIFLLMLLLESMFFSGPAVKELPYSKFRDLIPKDKIESVILESDKIYSKKSQLCHGVSVLWVTRYKHRWKTAF